MRRRWGVLIAVLLLASTGLASAHLHADGPDPIAGCAVCHLAKGTAVPVAAAPAFRAAPPAAEVGEPERRTDARRGPAPEAHRARSPPLPA